MEAQAIPAALAPRNTRLGPHERGVDGRSTVAFTAQNPGEGGNNGHGQTFFIYLERFVVPIIFGHFYRGIQHGTVHVQGRPTRPPPPQPRDERNVRGVKCVYVDQYNARVENGHTENPDNEIDILAYITERSTFQTAFDHHIILPQRVLTNKAQTDLAESGERYYMIISPYANGGDLFEQLSDLNGNYDLLRSYCRQVVRGVQYLHSLRIFHADLKPENFVTHNGEGAFIIDFGQAVVIPEGVNQIDNGGHGYGTKLYTAPEFVTDGMIDWRKADVWALGVSFFMLLLNMYPPWAKTDNNGQVKTINVHNRHFQRICRHGSLAQYVRGHTIPDAAVDLLQRMLFENVEERISIDEILAHPWMRD